jgi:hypothetical protein
VGRWVSHLIYVAAKLELTDRLKDGPRTVEQLATAAEVQAPALYRPRKSSLLVVYSTPACKLNWALHKAGIELDSLQKPSRGYGLPLSALRVVRNRASVPNLV